MFSSLPFFHFLPCFSAKFSISDCIPGPLLSLSVAVLDAIKNKAYRLRPVENIGSNKKAKPNDDLGIGEILARRMAMGYGEEDILEEEEVAKENSFMNFK